MKNMIINCLILGNIGILSAQVSTEIRLLEKAFTVAPKKALTEKFVESRQNPNELQMILSGLFLTYKTLISSQDQDKCVFTPSCSEYGLMAVKKFGIIKGGISTMDRMTRCNGFNVKKYSFDFKTNHLSDPVSW
jgi:uncharacterized protein